MAEDDGFYYEDYTTVTPWEKFVDNLGKIFSTWKLLDYKGLSYSTDDFDGSWQCQSKPITLNGKFDIAKYLHGFFFFYIIWIKGWCFVPKRSLSPFAFALLWLFFFCHYEVLLC